MKKYLIIFFVTIFAIGCSDDWLTLYPTNAIADDQAIETVADGRVAMNGVYVRLRNYQLYGRNMFVCADVGCEDVILRTDNSNRYNNEYYNSLRPGDTQPSGEMWIYAYSGIKRANEVIQRLSPVTPEPGQTEEGKNHIIGEAYFVRALLHYDLVKFFAQAYNFTNDASHLGVPYIVESTMECNHPRLTVKECFENIVADAEEALKLMDTEKPSVPYTAGKNAVNALLARVYLYMACTNDGASFAKAAEYAEKVIAGGYAIVNKDDYKITGSNTSFDSPKMWGAAYTSESIFVLPSSSTERNYTNSIGNIYLDKNKGYGDLKPSEQLVALFDDNDSRKTVLYEYDNAWCNRKFMGDGRTAFDISNLNIFRLSEMYLIAAEGNAKASAPDATKALGFLNTLKTNRGLAEVNLSGQALTNEIVLERRRELCFEGHALTDHKRLNTPIVRTPDKINPGNQNYGLEYYHQDPKLNKYFAMPIPDKELSTNELMIQNPEY